MTKDQQRLLRKEALYCVMKRKEPRRRTAVWRWRKATWRAKRLRLLLCITIFWQQRNLQSATPRGTTRSKREDSVAKLKGSKSRKIFDSLYNELPWETKEQIAALLQTKESAITLEFANVQKQRNGADCGVFAIAFALLLQWQSAMGKTRRN